MIKVRSYNVVPALPERLSPLKELASNLWWTWNSEAILLFQRMEVDLWEITYHNPMKMLGMMTQSRLLEIERDESFLSHMDRVFGEFMQYMGKSLWFDQNHADKSDVKIAYFSFEFGLHESIPNYSGGLGVLSGDHLKSASDLGLPLVAMGLAYQEGYFRQYLTPEGWQQELYPDNDFYNMPMSVMKDAKGAPILISVDLPGRRLYSRIWRIDVGRVPLYLLDTNIPENNEDDRAVTSRLYGGDTEFRIKQEMLLGIGGMRALSALGVEPHVCHMNEGHSAFISLERIRTMMSEKKLSFAEAFEVISATNIFTTHTPVPAGIDVFPAEMVERYMHNYHQELGMDCRSFLGLGRKNIDDDREPFNMAIFALKTSCMSNGVSALHGSVSRKMWSEIWPGLPEDEIPIGYITNGVHLPSWTSNEMQMLLNRYLGPRWKEGSNNLKQVWERADKIPDAEIWRTHERRRERLVAFARRRMRDQLIRRQATRMEIERADEILDPEALTIGFSRRFATYKRATLLLQDVARLKKLLTNKDMPVQIIFAGKAHPHDGGGKGLIKQLIQVGRDEELAGRFIFLEDYDVNVARYIIQGSDIWLNTPRRPMEASGTSGMKAVVNGTLNLAVLDGWWVEGYNPDVGWAIGSGEDYNDPVYQDEVESRILYELLEKEIVPLFYDRGADDLPRGWISRIKTAMRQLCPVFNTYRMVREYSETFYFKGADRWKKLLANDMAALKELTEWRERIKANWPQAQVLAINSEVPSSLQVGGRFKVNAVVRLAGMTPNDVVVQLYWGQTDSRDNLINGQHSEMLSVESPEKGVYVYEGYIPAMATGKHGFAVRLLPNHHTLAARFEPRFITWG